MLKLREAHAAHIRKLLRSGDDGGDERRGYGKVEMWRTADIAVFARLGGSMVDMKLLRGAGVDMNWKEWLLEWKSILNRGFRAWKMEVVGAMR